MNDEVRQYIPHRPPFLFVDRILHMDDVSIETQKDVKADEPYFAGHYPDRPIMPGVLICECVLQSGAIFIAKQSGDVGNKIPVVTRINNVKIRTAVYPGDVLDISVKIREKVSNAWYMEGNVKVGGKTALSLDFAGMLVEETA